MNPELKAQIEGCMKDKGVAYTYQNEGQGEVLLLNPDWLLVHDQMVCIVSPEKSLYTLEENPLIFKSHKEAKGGLAVLQVIYKEELKEASVVPYDPTAKMLQIPVKKSVIL